LRITHVDCFGWTERTVIMALTYDDLGSLTYDQLATATYDSLSGGIFPVPEQKKGIAFITSGGAVSTVNFEASEELSNGVLLLGKYEINRTSGVEHQQTTLEVTQSNNTMNFYLIPTYDGKTLETAVPAFLFLNKPRMRLYQKVVVGQNVSFLVTGGFNLVSLVTSLTVGGTY